MTLDELIQPGNVYMIGCAVLYIPTYITIVTMNTGTDYEPTKSILDTDDLNEWAGAVFPATLVTALWPILLVIAAIAGAIFSFAWIMRSILHKIVRFIAAFKNEDVSI